MTKPDLATSLEIAIRALEQRKRDEIALHDAALEILRERLAQARRDGEEPRR